MMSEALATSSTRHAVYLERLKSGEVNQFAAFLQQIDRSIKQRLSSHDLTEFSRARLERLLTAVDSDLSEIFSKYYDQLAGHLLDLAEYESEFEVRNLQTALIAGIETVIPAPAQVRAAVLSTPLSVRGPDGGQLIEPFIKDWTSSERKRVTGAIRQGFFEGQTTLQIIRNVRGSKANKYRDGILAITQRNADAVVRTAIAHTATTARMETLQNNADLLEGMRWVSTLDSRTSSQCRSLDNEVFPLDKGPRPPVHIRCRSTVIAVLKERYRALSEGATRASKGGYVDASLTYYQWLKKQPLSFIQDAIGPTRAKLLIEGGLTAERFAALNLGRNFKPLTLAEMKLKEPIAFERAGL
ncbi:minor capsid protein [Microbulbifer sp. VTAC004]|uniref:minor capsid protein n=2 Tax=unclassified Microbulbifer TaxID=2619833 RepID=UPI0040390F6E